MATEIETLTEEEREFLRCSWANFDDVGSDEATKMKALRIIDGQTQLLGRLRTGAQAARVVRVSLRYPRVAGEGTIDTIEVDLEDVRAARSIRVTYDFDRDGFVISAQDDPGDGECTGFTEEGEPLPWREKAFVPAWEEAEDEP